MANTKSKNYWYVIVMTGYGAVFVTKVNNGDRTAEWEKLEKPLEMTKSDAQFLSMGLTMNGHLAYSICSSWEITNQPYFYSHGEMKWVDKEE